MSDSSYLIKAAGDRFYQTAEQMSRAHFALVAMHAIVKRLLFGCTDNYACVIIGALC